MPSEPAQRKASPFLPAGTKRHGWDVRWTSCSLRCSVNAAHCRPLNAELDQRVAARTREIERLAEQARYDAVVRERLKIARDLHDTLAHSMMAMLTEIRLLKRLSATNPGALAEELMRAEETAHQGLKEARAAIAQMRFNPVRDAGLAAALGDFVELFVERTGIPVDYTSDAQAGAFADERAETLFRIAEEAMRNVERHAGATRVTISLRVSPDGRRIDPDYRRRWRRLRRRGAASGTLRPRGLCVSRRD